MQSNPGGSSGKDSEAPSLSTPYPWGFAPENRKGLYSKNFSEYIISETTGLATRLRKRRDLASGETETSPRYPPSKLFLVLRPLASHDRGQG